MPILLWIFGKGMFRDPRAGFLMVLVSGSVFGGVEGAQYLLAGGQNSAPAMAMMRPVAEASHPVWTAIAATMIWFAAARLGRLVTWVGLVGWLMAAGLHSLHDGLLSFSASGTQNNAAAEMQLASVEVALISGAVLAVYGIMWLVIAYAVLKYYAARELTPPTAISANPPGWRPRLVHWAMPKASVAKELAAVP